MSIRPDTFSAADNSRKDYMPSTTSTSNLLPFSIDEILRDRQGIIDHGSEPQPSNIVHDVSGSKHDFPHFEGKTGVDFKDGAYYCYCAYVLRISRYSDFLSIMLTNTGIFLRGLKLSGESRS